MDRLPLSALVTISAHGPSTLPRDHELRPVTRWPPLRYLAQLSLPRAVLWCYLIWWIYTAARYFDPNPRLWLSSIGISAIIGTGLYLSTAHAGARKTVLDRWQIFRLYLMPFCVSSFAALIKDRGFVLVFHPTWAANAEGLGYCLAFAASVRATRWLAGRSG